MAGVYRPRHPERTALYVERYLDCGNPRCGFAREVLADLVRKELLSPEWTERILSWRHTGFSVHSRVRTKSKLEADASSRWLEGTILLTRLAQLQRQRLFLMARRYASR